MNRMLYRKEDFGYIIAFPNGKINIYSSECEGLINANILDETKYSPYCIKKMDVGSEFRLKAPLWVWLEITRNCNMSCKHCYIRAGEPRDNEMSTEEVYSLIDKLSEMGVFLLILTGGEPLLRKDIVQVTNYAHSKGMLVNILTNGSLLDEDLLASFPKDNLAISISLDGTRYHSEIRGKYDFEYIASKIKMVKDFGIPCVVNTSITKGNINEIFEVIDWCDKNSVICSIRQVVLMGRARDHAEEMTLDAQDIKKIKNIFKLEMLNAIRLKPLAKDLYLMNFYEFILSVVKKTRMCKGGRSVAYIASNGDIYPCTNCASEEMFGAGNMLEKDFSKIWEGSFSGIRNITWKDYAECRGCKLDENYLCASRCPVLAKNYRGDMLKCSATPFDKMLYDIAIENIREIYKDIGALNSSNSKNTKVENK